MPSDYAAIREANRREYGEGIGRWGPEVLANRYDDSAHFIYELLQNAEDALAKRPARWQGKRAVTFRLSERLLRVSHFGKPFDEQDVRGICGIAESRKELTEIGRFGIGFKSVYAFTDRPEVHSGDENFAIENFVLPMACSQIARESDETIFLLPLGKRNTKIYEHTVRSLEGLGPRILLFLRHIEEIAWSVEGGPSGLYLRSKPKTIDENVRRITIIGEKVDHAEVEETWLIFSSEAKTRTGRVAGYAEIAFLTKKDSKSRTWSIEPIDESPLVVFFPTVLPTGFGFLVQGPYRTTPSRDNVPADEPWNQHLVRETAKLVIRALRWFRDKRELDVGILECLPIDKAKYPEGSRFAPVFDTVRQALTTQPLLPRFGGGYVSANSARLGRTQELRELFSSSQLAHLVGRAQNLFWLSGDITSDRTPGLRRYVMQDLGVAELSPEAILPLLKKDFLEAQPDAWILKLYEFLNGQPALSRQAGRLNLPLVRLESGKHVVAVVNGQPQAFLPSEIETDFPTVRGTVCSTEEAQRFLRLLGLTEPDAVDNVIRNILPKYRSSKIEIRSRDYETDIRRIVEAFQTDSKAQREKLAAALRSTAFVASIDAGDGSKCRLAPGAVYLATERLKRLFAGIGGVYLVDDSHPCLRGEEVRELLEACGATRYLQPIEASAQFDWYERAEMRRKAGCEDCSFEDPIKDTTLRGLDELLNALPELDVGVRGEKAKLLWEALSDLVERRGASVLSCTYYWTYYHRRSTSFPAAFVRQLNEEPWVPDVEGDLQRPELVLFETLGWSADPILLSRILFKPPIIETLAKEAGIEPGALDLLKRLGVTSEARLRELLRVDDDEASEPQRPASDEGDATHEPLGIAPEQMPVVPGRNGWEPSGASLGPHTGSGNQTRGSSPEAAASASGDADSGHRGESRHGIDSGGGRPFISYVGVHPEDEDGDPDGLDHRARMELEERAILFVLTREPHLKRTPAHNPGYDLFEAGDNGEPVGWIEVKAMTGTMRDRHVGLSRAQFESAREHGDAYWLYVVEHAGSDGDARLVRINDPAGKARTFTFDRGWLEVAEVDGERH